MKKLYCYAIEINSAGRFLHRFASTNERLDWFDSYQFQRVDDSIRLLSSTHPDVRRVKRRIAQGEIPAEWPVKLDY